MRYLVITGAAVIAGILIRYKSEYRNRILICFGVSAIIMSGLYNVRLLGKLLPFYRPVNQTFYQTRFLENGEYPDSLLMLLFKDKKVYVKKENVFLSQAQEQNKSFLYAYYHAKNEYRFLEYAGAELIKDKSMNDVMLTEEKLDSDFEELGITNDMFRYCFMYNNIKEEPGNYFNYYWYYYEYLDTVRAYMNVKEDSKGETVFDADEMVMLWDTADEGEEEDIYIMTKDYYDREVAHVK